MKLMTKEIEKKLPPLYATDGSDEKKVIVKFFTPWTSWTWYIVEGDKHNNGDYEFFGYVDNGTECSEWGYVMLSDLMSIKGPSGLKIERDRNFEGKINLKGELI